MAWFAFYLVALFASAFWHTPQKSGKNYFVYERKAGTSLVCFSLLASCIGGSATIGMLGLAWQVGFPAFWWLGAGSAGLLALGFFLARKVRASRAWTMPQLIETSLGPAFRRLAALIIFISYLAIMAAQFGALQSVLANLTGLSPGSALLTGIFTVLLYTFPGGQAAVIRSDLWQFAIILAMLAALLLFCFIQPEPREILFSMPLELSNANFPPSRIIYFLFILGGSFLVGPMLFGRLLSACNGNSARRGTILAAFALLAVAIAITCVGVAMRAYPMPANIAPQDTFAYFAEHYLPKWANAPILLGMFSIILSSADSCLLTAATVCANDLFKKPDVRLCRLLMLVICLLAYWLALQGHGILALLLMANDVYVCGLVAPIFIAILAAGKFKIKRSFMLLAMIAGGTAGLLAAWTGIQNLSLAALAISLLLSLTGLSGRKNFSAI